MRIKVKKPFRLRHPDGSVREYTVGDEITLEASATLHRLLDEGFVETPITEGRRNSLAACMDSTLRETMREIRDGGRWRMNPSVEEIEIAIHAVYEEVLQGLKRLSQYREIVTRWKDAGTVH